MAVRARGGLGHEWAPGGGGGGRESWTHLGRKRIFFAAERDLHQGTLRVLKLPEWPPALRERMALRRARAPGERFRLDFHQVGLLGGDELVRKAAAIL